MTHSEELSRAGRTGDATHRAAAELLATWLLDTDAEPAPVTETLAQKWVEDLVHDDPEDPLDWREERRDLAGHASTQVSARWPSFDSVVRHFRHPDGRAEFLALGARIDHGDVSDFVSGLRQALRQAPTPRLAGVALTTEDEESVFLSAVLDLSTVDFGGAAAVDQLVQEVLAPVEYWRGTLR